MNLIQQQLCYKLCFLKVQLAISEKCCYHQNNHAPSKKDYIPIMIAPPLNSQTCYATQASPT